MPLPNLPQGGTHMTAKPGAAKPNVALLNEEHLTLWLMQELHSERTDLVQHMNMKHSEMLSRWTRVLEIRNLPCFMGDVEMPSMPEEHAQSPSAQSPCKPIGEPLILRSNTKTLKQTSLEETAFQPSASADVPPILHGKSLAATATTSSAPSTSPSASDGHALSGSHQVGQRFTVDRNGENQATFGAKKIQADAKSNISRGDTHIIASVGTTRFSGCSSSYQDTSSRGGMVDRFKGFTSKLGSETRSLDPMNDEDYERMLDSILRSHCLRSSMYRVSCRKNKPIGGSYFVVAALQRIVFSPHFELFFGCLIIANGLLMAFQAQYDGFQMGFSEGFPKHRMPAKERWPSADTIFDVLSFAFGVCFTLEVLMKIIVLRCAFLKGFWNWFDAIIVLSWVFYKFHVVTIGNPTLFKLLRLGRVIRIFRLARTFSAFDVLHLMVGSIQASLMVSVWSLIFLFLMMLMVAMFLKTILEDYMANEAHLKEKRWEVFQYFGTFSRAMITMWEITLGNWVPVCRLLMENVSEWFALFTLLWQGIVAFAFITVIRGVFLHETFKVAQTDEDLMIMQKQRMIQHTKHYITAFFARADTSGDGYVSAEEFQELAQDPRMKAWMAAMDMDISDAGSVFAMMDDGDGLITVDDLLHGFARLKGSAKSVDVAYLMSSVRHMSERIDAIICKMGIERLSAPARRTQARVRAESG